MTAAGDAEDLLGRAADPGAYQRWAEQVARAGYCEHPIRLVGKVDQADTHTGEVRTTYDTTSEPDGMTLVACGNRRASRCQPCSEVYRRDAWQLIAAGLRGGKGVPAAVASHPRLFVTLTAPSFGPVHTCRQHGPALELCHPRPFNQHCPHGRPLGCWQRHRADDPGLGAPICQDCYDYRGAVVWNALSPALWKRTTVYLRRALARNARLTVADLGREVRVSHAKVTEYQQRGTVHYHALIRLDGATRPTDPERHPAPPPAFTATLLERAVREAVTLAAVPWPAPDGPGPRGASSDPHPTTGAR